MYWIIQTETRSNCRINTRYFPYDIHHCQLIFLPERSPNIMIENLFSIVVSFYTQPISDWKLLRSEQWWYPAPYYDGLQDTTMLVDEKSQATYDIKSSMFFEFEFERKSTMLVNSWLIPFIVLMLASNFVFLITESGKTCCVYSSQP